MSPTSLLASCASPPCAASSHLATPSESAGDASSRCRYKTGRCSNARVVKPNGSLLLLCEFHRDQQNRTKKRSDMKYRHHRTKKRQLDKHSPRGQDYAPPTAHGLGRLLLSLPSTPVAERHCGSTRTPTDVVARPAPTRPSLPSHLLSPIVSTPAMMSSRTISLHAPGGVLARRESASGKRISLYKVSAAISPAKLRVDSLRTRGTFASSCRDIVVMASPARKPSSGAQPLSPMVFPPSLSPLRLTSPWASRASWQPEDVRLLEYFIF